MSNIDRIKIYKVYSAEAKKQKEEMKKNKVLKNAPHKQIKNK